MRPEPALALFGLVGLVYGIPVAENAKLSSLQALSICHDSQMQASCPGYAKVMRFCCEQAGGRDEHDDTCDMYAKTDTICGGHSGMMRTMSSCCALEWGCEDGYCGSPDEPKVNATHTHVGKALSVDQAPAGTGRQEAQRSLTATAVDDGVMGQQQQNIEVWTDGTKEGIEKGYAAAAEKAIAEAPKFDINSSDVPEETGCVSIQAAVNDFWCTTTCGQGGHCPKQLCKCGDDVKCIKDEKSKDVQCRLKDSAAEKVRAARDVPEPEADWSAEAATTRPKAKAVCVAISPSVTDYWCTDTCVSLLSGLVHGGCNKASCSCGADADAAKANVPAKPYVKQRARHEGEVGFEPAAVDCNLDKSADGCTSDEIMKQLQDRQTAAPSWDDAHPAEKRQKGPPTWEEAHANGAPTWDDAHSKGTPTWNDAHANGEPTWDAAHPTMAKKGADKAALACVSLDISVSPDWCRTTCSVGGCPKVCACGSQDDLDSGKLERQLHPEVPAPTTNKAVIQHALTCISLVPSVTDDWCLSTCSSEQPDCEEEWCEEARKSCKATCRCGVAENLVTPGAPAVWEKTEEVPMPKCKSLSPSVMDFWCDTQCAIGASGKCPTNVCNCDGTLQLRTSSTKKQATAPTWDDAHPKPEGAEAKDEIVCKALDNSVTAHWCQTTCSNGHHCPKACACGSPDENLQLRESRPQPTAPTWADAHPATLKESAAGQEEASEANCRSLKAGISDFWCNTQCADGGSCPTHVCSCDGDSELKESKPLPTAPTWADAHPSVEKKEQKGAPTWADAHPSSVLKVGEAATGQQGGAAEARQVCRSIKADVLDYWCNTQCNGGNSCPKNVCSCDGDSEMKESKPLPTAPTWDDAHSKTTKGAPTWDDAHPTTAKQMGAEAKKVIVCRALDTSVTESWCRNSCSSGTHCPKVCSCGPSEDFLTQLREEFHGEPQRARVSALVARQQEGSEGKPKKKCRSLKPSVMDYWCDTQCADGLKCPTNVCSCDGDLQLRESHPLPTAPTWEDAHPSEAKQKAAPTWADAHPSSLVPEEPAVRQQEAQAKPKVSCKSLRAGILDYWCDTQCADGLKCPTNVCNCDESLQLRETTGRAQPTAPTWNDAHPSKAKSESAEPKIDIVCKALDASVTEHWCRTTCSNGRHCPKKCVCGDLLKPSAVAGHLPWAEWQRLKVSALAATRQGSEEAPKKKCRSLKPSVMDYWCDTQCADGLKCPTNVCSCDGDLQLRESRPLPTAPTWADAHPSSLVPEEPAVRQQEAQAKPQVSCKSLRAGILDYWCDTQCADGLKCPTNVCNCDESLQLRETTGRAQPTAPTWNDAHPSKAKSESAEPKIDIVCKSLDASVTEHWCRTTCSNGRHCPNKCACGDLLRPSDEAQGH